MDKKYYYERETIKECKAAQWRRGILFCILALFPLSAAFMHWNSVDKCFAVLTLCLWGAIFLFLHYLILKIENYTIEHGDDYIVINDECVTIFYSDGTKLTLNRGWLRISYRYNASGSAIFDIWDNNVPGSKITFTTHMKDVTELVNAIDSSCCWPPAD